jgi:UDP-glucose 4-epimerase
MNILLTGGTGFIGSYITMELLSCGHHVTILARNKNKVAWFNSLKRLEIVEGDITDQNLLTDLVIGKDACIHAALNYTRKTGWKVLRDDTLPTVYLSDEAAAAGVKHFIYTSSTAVNDSLYSGIIDERQEPQEIVTAHTKQRPATMYGATKAASENYLIAQSYRFPMRVTIIRPGYTFGNPVVPGASTETDERFYALARSALENRPITIIKNDGTQFIWAGDLAKVFTSALNADFNRKTYFALSRGFVSWQTIAEEAIRLCNSKSDLIIEDKGWRNHGLIWDVSDIKKDFGLEFDSWNKIREHLEYCLQTHRSAL